VPRVVTCGVLALLIALTIRQGGYWKDDFTFFSHDTEVNPESYTGFINLGGAYQRQHNLRAAIAAFRRAVAINPQYPLAVGDLANALNDAGQFDDAIIYARQAVELQTEDPNLRPNWPQDNELLGELLVQKGRFAQAILYLQTAAALEPDNQHLARELTDARRRAAGRVAEKVPLRGNR
jgi:tetratricopeptide (TPR) repeat protein